MFAGHLDVRGPETGQGRSYDVQLVDLSDRPDVADRVLVQAAHRNGFHQSLIVLAQRTHGLALENRTEFDALIDRLATAPR